MLFKLGRGYLRSKPAVLRGINLYLGLFIRAGVLMSVLSPTVRAADLPVPCGGGACAAGGGPSVWVSAGNVQAPTVTGSTMHINQESEKAILNWSSFNIGAGAGVDFKQPDASAVALNRIFQGDPSKILGALHANGQIYLINQNGFLFGSGATVNVHGLVASTLDVDTNLFKSSGIAQAINQGTPSAAFKANGKMGDINIAPGAVIKTDDGGQVMIFAPNITNDGEIDTPKGQTILAASKDNVYLKINSPSDPGLRGFLVEVNDGGTVTNGGKISVGEGNATLEGLTVNQDGMVSATTSVQLNGSIRLLARDQVDSTKLTLYSQGSSSPITTNTGSVTFDKGSITQVQPETNDTSTTVDAQTQLPSTVDVMAKTIDMKGGSKIVAPGGQVNLTAVASPEDVGKQAHIPSNDSRILMEAQSLIDVSGTSSTVLPMSRNTVQLQLRGNELADSPLQRNGALYGQTVTVDVRKGTPLANVAGAIKGIQRTVSERLSARGTVSASSEGDVVVAKGATVNFSGGQVAYQGGYLNTSKLMAKNGTVVDIGNADPNQTYTAVLGTYRD
ncbi:MAG TPA: filamentous hemagglutinin N-terminal domain-containing protein, partial [Pseudodesulfovibrio sp.]|nr:filamentous hemagglutinin N-terminal domain-containing protein [Pseudodesulfovibrio sp.]